MYANYCDPRVVVVTLNSDFSLTLTFTNGKKRKFDMTPYIDRSPWFEELCDWNYFAQASSKLGTVVWPNRQDLWPDMFYLDSVPIQ